MKAIIPVLCILVLAACHRSSSSNAPAPAAVAPMQDTSSHFTAAMVDSKSDPVCGMPSTAGMQDTIHYQGKVIGFCSDECRNQFLKDPKKYTVVYK